MCVFKLTPMHIVTLLHLHNSWENCISCTSKLFHLNAFRLADLGRLSLDSTSSSSSSVEVDENDGTSHTEYRGSPSPSTMEGADQDDDRDAPSPEQNGEAENNMETLVAEYRRHKSRFGPQPRINPFNSAPPPPPPALDIPPEIDQQRRASIIKVSPRCGLPRVT